MESETLRDIDSGGGGAQAETPQASVTAHESSCVVTVESPEERR